MSPSRRTSWRPWSSDRGETRYSCGSCWPRPPGGDSVEALPDSIEEVVAARIDRLPSEDRYLLRRLSVLGRSFSLDLLNQVIDDLPDPSDSTWARMDEFVQREGAGQMSFRNGLLRDCAYDGLSFRHRRELHSRAGIPSSRWPPPKVKINRKGCRSIICMPRDTRKPGPTRWQPPIGPRLFTPTWTLPSSTNGLSWPVAGWSTSDRRNCRVCTRRWATPEIGLVRTATPPWPIAQLDGWCPMIRCRRPGLCSSWHVCRVGSIVMPTRCVGSARGSVFSTARTAVRPRYAALSCKGGTDASARRKVITPGLSNGARWPSNKRSLPEAKERLPRKCWPKLLRVIDWAKMDLGLLEKPLNWERSLALFEEIDDLSGAASVLNMLGGFAYFRGDWDEALSLYRRAQVTDRRTGNAVNDAFYILNMGEIALDQGHLDEAEQDFETASRAWRAAGYRSGAADVKGNSARVFTARGLYEKALKAFDECIRSCGRSEAMVTSWRPGRGGAEFASSPR